MTKYCVAVMIAGLLAGALGQSMLPQFKPIVASIGIVVFILGVCLTAASLLK